MPSETGSFLCTQRAENTLNIKKLKATQEKNYNKTIWYLRHDFTFAFFFDPGPDMSFSLGENWGKKDESPSAISSLLEDSGAFTEFEFSHGCVFLVAALPPLCLHSEISLSALIAMLIFSCTCCKSQNNIKKITKY